MVGTGSLKERREREEHQIPILSGDLSIQTLFHAEPL